MSPRHEGQILYVGILKVGLGFWVEFGGKGEREENRLDLV